MPSKITTQLQKKLVSDQKFNYACLACGALCVSFFFAAFIACGFIPPAKPTWSIAHTAGHYRKHEAGVRVGAMLMGISGVFYIPYSALISSQMKRIPNLPFIVSQLQVSAAAGGLFTFIIPSVILAVAVYRPERSDETFVLLNDTFWILAFMTWPIFMVQNWCFAYAILADTRECPLIPRYIGFVNFVAPLIFSPGLGVHCVKSGPVAWNGALTFWLPGVVFVMQVALDSWSLHIALQTVDEDSKGDDVPSGSMFKEAYGGIERVGV